MGIGKLALSPTEAAAALGISRVKVFGLMKEGRLRRVKLGRRTVIPRGEIDRLLAAPQGSGEAV
jgi:excisionase family DNA binding protein